MTYLKEEIASQPDCWRKAAEAASAPGLPAAGERVAVVGCGTSWFMAKAYASRREQLGAGETDAYHASEFAHGRRYDRVVAITRSGTNREVIDLLDALDGRTPTTVITSDGAQSAAAVANEAVVLDFAQERSAMQTRFPTSTLALLRAHLGEDLGPIAADAEVAVRLPLPVHPALAEQITFLGRGWTVGLADEAALKCREAAMYWAESCPAMDYWHGPIAIAGPRRVVWAFGEIPAGLADDVEAAGASFVHSRHHGGYAALGNWRGGRAPLDPMADLVLAQRVAVLLATAQGRDPDNPRASSRRAVLT